MKPEYHIIISLALSTLFYLFTQSSWGALALFLSGFMIDLDHVIDFWISEKKMPWNVREFFDHFYRKRYSKTYILLHSLEFFPLIFVGFYGIFGKTIAWGIIIGMLSHLTVDYLTNGAKPLSYFICYRILNKFDIKCFKEKKKNEN